MSTWAEVDEAARRMAAAALEEMGWVLDPTSGGHWWVAWRKGQQPIINGLRPQVRCLTAVSLVTRVEEVAAEDKKEGLDALAFIEGEMTR